MANSREEGQSEEFWVQEERELEDGALSLGLVSLGLVSSQFGNRDCSRPSAPRRPHFLLTFLPLSLCLLLLVCPGPVPGAHTHGLPPGRCGPGQMQDAVEGVPSGSLSQGVRGHTMGAVLSLL